MIDLASIETKLAMPTDKKILSLVRKCIRNNIPILISTKDYKKHKDMLERPAGHKLYTPKHFYKGKTIRQYLKETDSPLSTGIVYKRLKLGWDMDRALHTPKGDQQFKRKRFQSLAHSKKKLVIVGTIKGKAVTSDKISTLHKLQQYAEN